MAVAIWALVPLDGSLSYELGSSHQSRSILSPRHVPLLTSGFAGQQPWGRWTDRPTATLTFGRPFPRHLVLSLTGHAFGPNIDAPVRVCVPGDCETMRLAATDSTVRLTFHAAGAARSVTLHVPHAVSPGNGDPRLLGVGIVSVRVEEAR